MSEWNNSSAEERLEKWREFRESLEDLSEEDLLNNVAEFFAAVPIGARCIDFYTPESWPNPWELLYHKLFCTNSISLLIYHTLCVSLDKNRVEILLVETKEDRFLLPIVDKKHIFNYELGKVNNIKDHAKIKIIDNFSEAVDVIQ
jgi:hypothetical protein